MIISKKQYMKQTRAQQKNKEQLQSMTNRKMSGGDKQHNKFKAGAMKF